MRQVTQTVFEEAISMSCEASQPASQPARHQPRLLPLAVATAAATASTAVGGQRLLYFAGHNVATVETGGQRSSWQCWTVQLRLAV
jgi:hypothetical protein